MRIFTSLVVTLLATCTLANLAAAAELIIAVNKTTQRMSVSVNGQERYSWPVSTGMAGYLTPSGAFTPSRLARQHYSREWDNAPMPYSIFFTDAGHAIHGSQATRYLGTPASHGCVRLTPHHASVLFRLVGEMGLGNTRIEVTGVEPITAGLAGGFGAGRDFRGIASFDPLTSGIMSSGSARDQRAESRRRP